MLLEGTPDTLDITREWGRWGENERMGNGFQSSFCISCDLKKIFFYGSREKGEKKELCCYFYYGFDLKNHLRSSVCCGTLWCVWWGCMGSITYWGFFLCAQWERATGEPCPQDAYSLVGKTASSTPTYGKGWQVPQWGRWKVPQQELWYWHTQMHGCTRACTHTHTCTPYLHSARCLLRRKLWPRYPLYF